MFCHVNWKLMRHHWNNLFLFSFCWHNWRVILSCLVDIWTLKEMFILVFFCPYFITWRPFTIIYLWLFIHYCKVSCVFWNAVHLMTQSFFSFAFCFIFNFISILNFTQFYKKMEERYVGLIPINLSLLLFYSEYCILSFCLPFHCTLGSRFIFPCVNHRQNISHVLN